MGNNYSSEMALTGGLTKVSTFVLGKTVKLVFMLITAGAKQIFLQISSKSVSPTIMTGNFKNYYFLVKLISFCFSYDKNGNLKDITSRNLNLTPQKLSWDVSEDSFRTTLEDAYKEVTSIIDVSEIKLFKISLILNFQNVDHQIGIHKKFGSGLIKTFKVLHVTPKIILKLV